MTFAVLFNAFGQNLYADGASIFFCSIRKNSYKIGVSSISKTVAATVFWLETITFSICVATIFYCARQP